MSFDINLIVGHLFRAGYHAWRHTRSPDYPAVSPGAEAREVKGVLQEADQIAKDHGGIDGGVKQARSHMESRELEVKIKDGRVINLVRSLESYLRNHSDKRLWGWWHAGLNAAALEFLHEDSASANANKDVAAIRSGIQGAREALTIALGVAGVPSLDLEHIVALGLDKTSDAIREYIKAHHPSPGDLDLLRLRAQHATGQFPDEDLLRRMGCSEKGIAVLRVFYDQKPGSVAYAEAGSRLFVSANATAQHYRELPDLVKESLLVDVGRKRQKAWRPIPTD